MSSYKPRPDIANLTPKEYLALLTTRELMSMLQNTRQFGDYTIAAQGKQNKYYQIEIRRDDLQEILKNRPHVPNKNESRGLRIKKIREGK